MRKYLFIYKSELMSNLQYVFNILISFSDSLSFALTAARPLVITVVKGFFKIVRRVIRIIHYALIATNTAILPARIAADLYLMKMLCMRSI